MASDPTPSSSYPTNKLTPAIQSDKATASSRPTGSATAAEGNGRGAVANISPDNGGEEEDDEDDEPKLKYTRLTKSLGGVYRNGDAVSCTWVGGDKMVRLQLKNEHETRDSGGCVHRNFVLTGML